MNNKLFKLLIVGVSLFPYTTLVQAQTPSYDSFVKYPNSPHIYRVIGRTYCRVQNPSQLMAFKAESRVRVITNPKILESKRNLGNCPWSGSRQY